MSLSVAQSLQSLALAQALMVVPALGDSYEGKTAATIAALLLMLGQAMEELPGRRHESRRALEQLLRGVEVSDPALALDLDHILAGDSDMNWMARDAVLMGALVEVHAWADRHDAALAARCRDWLADWAAGERLDPPRLPT